MLNVIHNESGGQTYANIDGVSKFPGGMDRPKLEGQPVTFSLDDWNGLGRPDLIPDFLWDKITQSPEYADKQDIAHGRDPMPGGDEFSADQFGGDDDIPF